MKLNVDSAATETCSLARGRFAFRTDASAESFCREIARQLVVLFDIEDDEAVHRINRFWEHRTELTADHHWVFAADQTYWARTIYFGPGSYWWIQGTQRKQLGLPSLEPQALL